MPTITQKFNPRLNVGATPWGNAHGLKYTLETNASGAAVALTTGANIVGRITVGGSTGEIGSCIIDAAGASA